LDLLLKLNKMVRKIMLFFLAVAVVVGCSKNAVTGRQQFKLVPEGELQSMAVQQYRQFLSTNKVVSPSADRDAEMVRRVGQRVSQAVQQYYRQQGMSDQLQGYQWEYNLVQDNAANAWCMPGGKIVVYSGLLAVTQNEAALAVVVGHEVSHALFQHGNERMSQGLVQQLGGAALSVAISSQPAATQNLFLQAYGVGSQVGLLLPFSRKQELESDRYGLRWAAMAGYNPREAIPLWQRMQKMAQGNKPPEFLSTHPAEETRIQQLQKFMPEALKYYKPVSR
jgi:predicted Zn-dependent protease